jgi:hypothetical protein
MPSWSTPGTTYGIDWNNPKPPQGMGQDEWNYYRAQHQYNATPKNADGSWSQTGTTPGIFGGQNSLGIGQGNYDSGDVAASLGFGGQFLNGVPQAASQDNTYSSLGAAAAYGGYGNADAGYQSDALAATQAVANGGDSASTSLARSALANGYTAQYATAASALGGSLGQAAAMRGAAQGEAGYYAQGQQQIAAQQAQDRATAQQQLASQYGDLRSSNQSGMAAGTQLGTAYAGAANDLASYNQDRANLGRSAGQFGASVAQQQLTSNYNQQQGEADYQNNSDILNAHRKQVDDANDKQLLGAGIGAVSSTVGAAFGMSSDARAKQPVKSLGYAAEMRLWK